MSRIGFALLAAAAIATPALAQTAGTTNFNGGFIGGQLGWQQDRQRRRRAADRSVHLQQFIRQQS